MAAHWSQWAPSPRRCGAGFEEATVASSVGSERKAQSDRLRSGDRLRRTFCGSQTDGDHASPTCPQA
eukprot:4466505-Prymnesium_polylepis.1